ncbi:MAG: cadherin-like beta sandwich domain-containing protein [Nitrospira sp.]|nr:cadherin-like beta sandwich domain-containing protein [Nitrospira sp.]
MSNAPAPPTPLSPNAKLSSLTVSPGTIQPTVFSSDVTNYTVDVLTNITNVTVVAQAQNAGAIVQINGSTTTNLSVTLEAAGTTGSTTLVTIVVTALDGSQNTYVVAVRRAAPAGNNNLQNLTVSQGTLDPVFNASTQNYTVAVATNISTVTVTAQAQDAGATVSINGSPVTSQIVTLGNAGTSGSSTLVTIIVTAPNGTQKPYLVTVNRAAPGGNNNLQSLTVSQGSLDPAFTPSHLNYTVGVATNITSVAVTAQAQDAGASVSINGAPVTTLSVPLGVQGSNTLVTIVVTAPNGLQNTYLVTVNRAAPGGNNNLSALTVSAGTLVPAFASATTTYAVAVPNATVTTTITATVADATATLTINGVGAISGSPSASISLAVGQNSIPIVVTAPNGNPKIYLVNVTRAAPGSNNNLSALSVSAGALAPTFGAAITAYDVATPNATTTTTITATLADSTASLTINGASAISGSPSASIPLAVGPNAIPVVVTAQNGNPKTYTVTITRAALGGNNNLSALIVSAGTLVPGFAAGTTTYDVAASNATVSTTITATVADSTATLTINGVGAISGSPSASIPLAVGANAIPVVVTAQNGTPKTYTVTVTRAALGGNNDLSALSVSAGALAPAFATGTTAYDVSTPNATVTTTITATVADSTATLTINGAAAISGAPSASIPLAVGANAIPIAVTAQNGTPKTYTVTITRTP